MKTNLPVLIIVALLAFFGSSESNAQCSDKNIRKQCKAGLENYIFETASSKPFTMFAEPRKRIDAAFSVYAQENYRILNLCEGFSGAVEFSVFDSQNNKLFTNNKDNSLNKFDFTAEKSGDYIIRFQFAEATNASACVAFAVGYK
ncbi:MAG: hypothetical protein V4543_16890 [Bacteroidota bacterium]